MKKIWKKNIWFTLIELVIVITIISIISTIWYISFSSYLVKSRDSTRNINVVSIASALDIYAKSNNGLYPPPSDSVILTYKSWSEDIPFSYLWRVKEDLKLNFNSLPKDPWNWEYFVYGLTTNRKYYQIWTTFEDSSNIAYNDFISKTYASNEYAFIYWNYKQDFDKWNYLTWLILLQDISWDKVLPKTNLNIWEITNSWITLSWWLVISENWSWEVPYKLFKKIPEITNSSDDFYIKVEWTTVKCPNCN